MKQRLSILLALVMLFALCPLSAFATEATLTKPGFYDIPTDVDVTVTALLENGKDPVAFCRENGLDRQVDAADVSAVVEKVLAENRQAVESYLGGKAKAFQALFGACMRELKGAGNHAVIKELLEQKLKK